MISAHSTVPVFYRHSVDCWDADDLDLVAYRSLQEAVRDANTRANSDRQVILHVNVLSRDCRPYPSTGICVLNAPRSIASFIADIVRLGIADGVLLEFEDDRFAEEQYKEAVEEHLKNWGLDAVSKEVATT